MYRVYNLKMEHAGFDTGLIFMEGVWLAKTLSRWKNSSCEDLGNPSGNIWICWSVQCIYLAEKLGMQIQFFCMKITVKYHASVL